MPAPQVLEMWMGGEAHEFRAPVPRVWAREGAASAGTGTVTTPMPGRIIKARRWPYWWFSGVFRNKPNHQ